MEIATVFCPSAEPNTFADMDNEYMKRGYLLPDGCKDLTHVPKPVPASVKPKSAPVPLEPPLPPVTGEISFTEGMTVRQLADVLKQKPWKTMADIVGFKVMVTLDHAIPIEVVAKVARKYGFTVRKAD